jgi:hypothetical protein
MIYVVMCAGALLLIIGLSLFLYRDGLHRHSVIPSSPSLKKALVNCPLCGSPLASGENLVSRIYRPMTVPDQRCTIAGCPHCYPVCGSGVKRVCPVCGKTVPADGYLIARLFNKTEGKKHVLITGCTECCKH